MPVPRRVAVYCGSAAGRDPRYAAAAGELGTALAVAGIGIVYGGGRVGLMGALADAALAAGGEVIGVIPHFLEAREVAHTGVDLRVVTTMHERKALMADLSDAFVALPGGFGTLEELFETVTWTQLGLHTKPTYLCDIGGFYGPLIAAIDAAVDGGFIAVHTRGIVREVRDINALLIRLLVRESEQAQGGFTG